MNMTRYVLDARTATQHFPGIGRYVFNLAQAMAPLLEESETLLLLRDAASPAVWDLIPLAGERIRIVNITCSPFSFSQQWIIPRLLHHLRVDFYHSPYYLMPYRPGVPTLLTMYDLIPLLYPQYASIRARLLFRWTTKLALRAAAHTIAISQATHHDLLEYYSLSPSRLTTIPLAADPIFRPYPPEAIADFRQRLDLPSEYMLYLGSNKPHKNLSRLVEAWATLQSRPAALLIAGMWDPRYPEAKEKVERLGLSDSVQFLETVSEDDLPLLYNGALAFIFPSEYEGFGLPVLEAMACGLPVACSNSSSLPEVAGSAALNFNPMDVQGMAQAIDSLLNDPNLRQSLRQQSLTQADRFSWQKTAQATLQLYRNLVSNGGA